MLADDLVHLVWVDGCHKKSLGGSKCVEICTFWTVMAFLGGQGQCVRDSER